MGRYSGGGEMIGSIRILVWIAERFVGMSFGGGVNLFIMRGGDIRRFVSLSRCAVRLLNSLLSKIAQIDRSSCLLEVSPLPQDREVFVIRTNYLWNDWVQVNNLLGSTYDVPVPSREDAERVINARGRLPVRNNVSEEGKMILCKYLKEEIRIYIDLLNRAVNLSDEDVRVTLEDLQRNCPEVIETFISESDGR